MKNLLTNSKEILAPVPRPRPFIRIRVEVLLREMLKTSFMK